MGCVYTLKITIEKISYSANGNIYYIHKLLTPVNLRLMTMRSNYGISCYPNIELRAVSQLLHLPEVGQFPPIHSNSQNIMID